MPSSPNMRSMILPIQQQQCFMLLSSGLCGTSVSKNGVCFPFDERLVFTVGTFFRDCSTRRGCKDSRRMSHLRRHQGANLVGQSQGLSCKNTEQSLEENQKNGARKSPNAPLQIVARHPKMRSDAARKRQPRACVACFAQHEDIISKNKAAPL